MLQIVPADSKDISRIRALALEIWPQTYGQILSAAQIAYMLDKIYSPAALESALQQGQRFLLARENDADLGFAGYQIDFPTAGAGKLHKLYVLPFRQRRGVGSGLLAEVSRLCIQAGMKQLLLNVNKYNTAQTFYMKYGFEISAEEDIDIGSGYFMNDFIMKRAL